jgi:hypothetical protein
LSEGLEWLAGSTEKLVSCPVENGLQRGNLWWLPMVGGHRSVAKGVGERAGGWGCGGEGKATGRFVSWLPAKIQLPKETAGISIMVKMSLSLR